MKENGADIKALERAKRAFQREVKKLPHFEWTESSADGLTCLCMVFGDHIPEGEKPYSAQGVSDFIDEEMRRNWRRMNDRFKDRAQNKFD